MFEESLRSLIMALPGLGGVNVAWGLRPQGQALPALLLHTTSDPMGGTYGGSKGLRVTRVQADAWATPFMAARDIASAIQGTDAPALPGLHLWRGNHAGVRYAGIYVVDGDSGFEETPTGVIYRRRTDLMVHHIALEE